MVKLTPRQRAERASGRFNKEHLKRTGFTAWGSREEWNAWVEKWQATYEHLQRAGSQSDASVKRA